MVIVSIISEQASYTLIFMSSQLTNNYTWTALKYEERNGLWAWIENQKDVRER